MNYPDAIHKGTKKVARGPHTFEFKNVCFSYPGSDVQVLKGINLKIEPCEHLSVVGLNGAGKTTFIKLLCRLYDPTSGQILMDGTDIREYDYQSYMNEFSPVFQDFKLFAFTFKENILVSDYVNDSVSDKAKEKKLQSIFKKTGLSDKIALLKKATKLIFLSITIRTVSNLQAVNSRNLPLQGPSIRIPQLLSLMNQLRRSTRLQSMRFTGNLKTLSAERQAYIFHTDYLPVSSAIT